MKVHVTTTASIIDDNGREVARSVIKEHTGSFDSEQSYDAVLKRIKAALGRGKARSEKAILSGLSDIFGPSTP